MKHTLSRLVALSLCIGVSLQTSLVKAVGPMRPQLEGYQKSYPFVFPTSFHKLMQFAHIDQAKSQITFSALPDNKSIVLNPEAHKTFLSAMTYYDASFQLKPIPVDDARRLITTFLSNSVYVRRQQHGLSANLDGVKFPHVFEQAPELSCKLTGFRFKIFNTHGSLEAEVHICAAPRESEYNRVWVTFSSGHALALGRMHTASLKEIAQKDPRCSSLVQPATLAPSAPRSNRTLH